MTPQPFRPTALEIAAGVMLETSGRIDPLPVLERPLSPLRAFEEALLPALRRPPCLVTFSGGRDSSTVLAVALDVARREGLPPPVAATVRFLGAPGADESDWQERIVRELGVHDWLKLDVVEELDFVGPVATRTLRAHGVLFPSHISLLVRLLDEAGSGSLLTGFGGDPVFGGWPFRREVASLTGRARPSGRGLLALGFTSAPGAARRTYYRRRARPPRWLRPAARAAAADGWARGRAGEPLTFARYLAWLVSRRRTQALEWSTTTIADAAGAVVGHPFLERRFVAALAAVGGRTGLGTRTAAMRAVFDAAVPVEVLEREDKALFHLVYFRSYTREFARRHGGAGVDAALSDPEVLAAEWGSHLPVARSSLALQAAWLATDAGELGEPLLDGR